MPNINGVDITDAELELLQQARAMGLPPHMQAGLVSSLTGESGRNLNPNLPNPTSGAYGIYQGLGPRKPEEGTTRAQQFDRYVNRDLPVHGQGALENMRRLSPLDTEGHVREGLRGLRPEGTAAYLAGRPYGG